MALGMLLVRGHINALIFKDFFHTFSRASVVLSTEITHIIGLS